MDLDPASWGGLELGLKIGPVKTSTAEAARAAGQAGVSCADPRPFRVPASAFAPHCVTLPELSAVLSRLSASRAVGVDGIPLHAIRHCFAAIASHILHLVNTSISTQTFPDAWKVAIVTPILKSGDPQNPGNFRPISILPALSKILEKVVCSQLSSYPLFPPNPLRPSFFAIFFKRLDKNQRNFRSEHFRSCPNFHYLDILLSHKYFRHFPLTRNVNFQAADSLSE